MPNSWSFLGCSFSVRLSRWLHRLRIEDFGWFCHVGCIRVLCFLGQPSHDFAFNGVKKLMKAPRRKDIQTELPATPAALPIRA